MLGLLRPALRIQRKLPLLAVQRHHDSLVLRADRRFKSSFTLAAAAAAGIGIGFFSGRSVQLEADPKVSISSCFDSGNIEFIKAGSTVADLNIAFDPFTEGTDKKAHAQWFHFQASNVRKGQEYSFRLLNAGKCSYSPGWVGYRACCSYDRESWFRVPTSYSEKDGILTITVTPSQSTFWLSYFAPYSYEKHQELVARCAQAPGVEVRSIGKSLEGRELDLITLGSGKLRVWFQARQHPGESMAEFWIEGFLDRLLDESDAKSRQLKELCTFYVLPNANPDGSVRGYLRTNAAGANLNREWAPTGDYDAPTLRRSPEVLHIMNEMEKLGGIDFFCDVHGDEELPHNFFAGQQGVSNWDDRKARLHQTLAEAYQRANPDFGSLLYNYGNDERGQADLRCADAQVAQRFGCLSVTLEQPFKDCVESPQPEFGWSPTRARRLGASMLDALDAVARDLRRDFTVDPSSLAPWVKPGYSCPTSDECSWEKKQ